jgi:glutaredoxin
MRLFGVMIAALACLLGAAALVDTPDPVSEVAAIPDEATPAASLPTSSRPAEQSGLENAADARPTAQAEPAGSGFYRYEDASGSLRIVESLAEVPSAYRDRAKQMASSRRLTRANTSMVREKPPAYVPDPVRAGSRVVVYSAPWCGWCRKTLAWLDARGVQYTNKDIDANPAFRDELIRKSGGSGIPYVEIGDEVVRGFSAARMEALL